MDTRRWSLAQVAERSGAKPRSLQLWADGGVIETTPDTDRAGTGVHRQFQTCELQIAALLVPLAETGMPIGVLREFAKIMRTAIVAKETGLHRASFAPRSATPGIKALVEHMRDHREIIGALARAERGEGRNYLALAHVPDSIWAHVATDAASPVCIDPDRDFAEADLPKSAAIIILDLTKILGKLAD
jgi:DNA-binding transcriptional MerR regulator